MKLVSSAFHALDHVHNACLHAFAVVGTLDAAACDVDVARRYDFCGIIPSVAAVGHANAISMEYWPVNVQRGQRVRLHVPGAHDALLLSVHAVQCAAGVYTTATQRRNANVFPDSQAHHRVHLCLALLRHVEVVYADVTRVTLSVQMVVRQSAQCIVVVRDG